MPVDDFTARLRQVLDELAPEARTITYQELALRIAVPPPHRIHKLTLALEALVRAALAVSRAPDALPGRGFFQLLAELGRYQGPDRGAAAAAAHAAELQNLRHTPAPDGRAP